MRFSATRLDSLLAAFSRSRILVIGDLMLDEFLWGKVTRISPEAPVPVVEVQKALPFEGLFATKAVLLGVVDAKTRLPTFIAVPLPAPPLHDGVPGQGGVEPLHTLLVTALDDTWSTMDTVTSDAAPIVCAEGTEGVAAVTVPASVAPPPSLPCQKQ